MMMTEAKLNTPRSARSLSTTLAIAFFTLSTVLLLVNGGSALYTNYLTYQDSIAAQQKLIAQEASKTVSSFIQDKFVSLETAVELVSLVNVSAETQKSILESLLGHDQAFRQFALLDSQGQPLAQISRALQTLSSQFIVQLKGDVLSQTSTGQRYISPVYIDDTTSEPLIAIAIPIKNVFGDFQGTLMAEVNLKFMWQVVDQLSVGQTGYAYVVDNQGNLIAFGDTSRVLAGENVKQIGEVKEFIDNPSATVDITPNLTIYSGLRGKSVVGTYVPLGTPQWAVVIELPVSEAYQPILQAALTSIITILFLAILAGVVGVFVARRLAAPLVDLSNAATEVARGNLTREVKIAGPAEIAHVTSTFNIMTAQLRELIGSLERRVSERTAQFEERSNELALISSQTQRRATKLQAVALVAGAITSIQNIETLLPRIAEVVGKQFDFSHVGIFLLDTNRNYAILTATNSPGGQKMLARQHKLRVGEVGIVGHVAESGQVRIALDTGADAVFFNNPDLPETRSEMALPLKVGTEIIGVLDVQSEQPLAFSEEDTELLSIVANQVSIAIQNARQFEEARKSLADFENLNRQYVQREWKSVVDKRATSGYRYAGLTVEPLAKSVEAAIQQSIQSEQINIMQNEAQSQIAVPIKLRGQVIGMINVNGNSKRIWGQDEIDIAQAIAERVAIASETVRLLEDSQRRATKERVISDISAKITGSISMDNILKTAVEELGQAIPSAEVVIQFQNPEVEQ